MTPDDAGETRPAIPDALHARPFTLREELAWRRIIGRAMTVEASRLYARLHYRAELDLSD